MLTWRRSIIDAAEVAAVPVMTYPGMALTGQRVGDVVTSGSRQTAMITALAQRYPHAAAVTMMDLSVEAEAFGSRVVFADDEVPTAVGAIVGDLDSARTLAVPPVGAARTGEYLDGMARTAAAITDRPVFGGVIGPFSLAGRLLDINTALLATRRSPAVVHAVLERTTAFLADYLRAVRSTGVDGVVIAEPLSGLLSPAAGDEFAFQYVRQLVAAVQRDTFAVILHNCGRSTRQIPAMAATGAWALHVGNSVRMVDVAPQISPDTLVMGNVDPAGVLRIGSPQQVRAATATVLEQMRPYPNFVLSSGCDIPPHTPLANIDAFFAALAEFSTGRG